MSYLLSEDGGFCRSRTSFDTSSSGCRPDELSVRSLLCVIDGVEEADAAGSTKTSEKLQEWLLHHIKGNNLAQMFS